MSAPKWIRLGLTTLLVSAIFLVAGCAKKCPQCKGECFIWGVNPEAGRREDGTIGIVKVQGGWNICPRCKGKGS